MPNICRAFRHEFLKNRNIFPEKGAGGGGGKGSSEIFQKIIHFGADRLPISGCVNVYREQIEYWWI